MFHRVQVLWWSDKLLAERIVGIFVPVAQCINLLVCLLLTTSRYNVGAWRATRKMLSGSGIIGLTGNIVLWLSTDRGIKVGYTPAGCSLTSSLVLWASMLAGSYYTDEGRRRLYRFVMSSTSLKALSETQLQLLSTVPAGSQKASSHGDSDRPQPHGDRAAGIDPVHPMPQILSAVEEHAQHVDGDAPLFAQLAAGHALPWTPLPGIDGEAYNPHEVVGYASDVTSSRASESAEQASERAIYLGLAKRLVTRLST